MVWGWLEQTGGCCLCALYSLHRLQSVCTSVFNFARKVCLNSMCTLCIVSNVEIYVCRGSAHLCANSRARAQQSEWRAVNITLCFAAVFVLKMSINRLADMFLVVTIYNYIKKKDNSE